jgi:DME family drug/metabolite transporter
MDPYLFNSKKQVGGHWFVLLAAIFWGTTGTSQAFAPEGFDSIVIGTLRLALGGSALLALTLSRGSLIRFGQWPFWTTLCAAAFTATYQLCFFAGVAKTGVAIGTIVGIGSAPVAGGILGYFFRGEKPGRRWLLATLLAIVGCALLTIGGSSGQAQIDSFGVALAIGAGVSYAAYTLAIKNLLERFPPDEVIAVVFLVGAALLTPLLWTRELAWLGQPRGVGVILYLGLVTAALAYWLFARGLQLVSVANAVTLSLAEPLTAGLLGVIVLKEQINAISSFGVVLLLFGLAILTLRGRRVSKAVPLDQCAG